MTALVAPDKDLRSVLAGNSGLFTLDGTRTYLVGQKKLAVIDPGPDVEAHVRAVSSAVEGADEVLILLTHGHIDHAGAAAKLAETTGARVQGAGPLHRKMSEGDRVSTDAGELVAVHTPGHTRDHLCFHWVDRKALFAGDLILGAGDTTWVAGYSGCVAEYLSSLEKVRSMPLDRIYPAHGEPIDDVKARLDRFAKHRKDRIAQVTAVLNDDPEATHREILNKVWGRIPSALEPAALESLAAILDYLGMADDGSLGVTENA